MPHPTADEPGTTGGVREDGEEPVQRDRPMTRGERLMAWLERQVSRLFRSAS
jgi:hypothetical protein